MSVAFLLLGKTNVAFFPAGQGPASAPRSGILGTFDDAAAALGFGDDAPTPTLELDVSIEEEHSLASDVTSFPVEAGSDISDNISAKPRELVIRGVITDIPSGIGALAIVPGLVDRFGGLPPSVAAFGTLKEMWRAEQPVDVVTGLEVYRNMAIVDVRMPKNAAVGRSLQFTIRLREIVVATSATAPAGTLDGLGTTDRGPTTVVPPP